MEQCQQDIHSSRNILILTAGDLGVLSLLFIFSGIPVIPSIAHGLGAIHRVFQRTRTRLFSRLF